MMISVPAAWFSVGLLRAVLAVLIQECCRASGYTEASGRRFAIWWLLDHLILALLSTHYWIVCLWVCAGNWSLPCCQWHVPFWLLHWHQCSNQWQRGLCDIRSVIPGNTPKFTSDRIGPLITGMSTQANVIDKYYQYVIF